MSPLIVKPNHKYQIKREINSIYLHFSRSSFGTPEEIDLWHKANGWRGIGYHFVILNGFDTFRDILSGAYKHARDGLVLPGRPLSQMGAHVRGANANSIGIVFIAGPNPLPKSITTRQKDAGTGLCLGLMAEFPKIQIPRIRGHREFERGKTDCPGDNFDLVGFRSNLYPRKEIVDAYSAIRSHLAVTYE